MMFYRTIACIAVGIVGIFCTPWLLLPLAIAYTFIFHRAYELVLVGASIDAFFGVSVVVPYYTIAAMLLVGVAELVKPHLTFYAYVRS